MPTGVALTVNPGTSLSFPKLEDLTVNGSLMVQGTVNNFARFSSGNNLR